MESDVIDIDAQISLLANFGTDVVYECSQVKWDMVVTVE